MSSYDDVNDVQLMMMTLVGLRWNILSSPSTEYLKSIQMMRFRLICDIFVPTGILSVV